ncbi:LysE family translocator [Micavibrio aeruginosavorus]|uniref:Lysine exporter protein (LYSE/YGGA) n=1 Tax=Micavibrio aeruginosavorus EPB TaxID=349215 RepID=M4VKV0_9BACT|nr:LysE family translocator [Micavibrio aeruginosavorus]AGH98731.1 Lysine exporter protein (LYSE/YGGA) [Micavibrio aeruginosavorus EPB]
MDMLSPVTILSFITTCVIVELTPGPNMAYLAILSASEGRRYGFAAVAGVALGLLVVGCAVAMGVATLISQSALAYQALRWGGIAYFFWLAWDGWKSSETPEQPHGDKRPHSDKKAVIFFQRGLITNLLNPKAAVFYIAILPNFITPSPHTEVQAVLLTTLYVCIATCIHTLIVTLAGTARNFLDDPVRKRIARRLLSLSLALVALWFLWTTEQSTY